MINAHVSGDNRTIYCAVLLLYMCVERKCYWMTLRYSFTFALARFIHKSSVFVVGVVVGGGAGDARILMGNRGQCATKCYNGINCLSNDKEISSVGVDTPSSVVSQCEGISGTFTWLRIFCGSIGSKIFIVAHNYITTI